MQLFPDINDQAEAERLVRRAWGGWLLLGFAGLMLLVTILAGLEPVAIVLFAVAVAALIGLNYALRFRRQPWAALVMGAAIVILLVRSVFTLSENGFAADSPLAAAVFPLLFLFALLSLLNGYRGALAIRGELAAGEQQTAVKGPAKQRSFTTMLLGGLALALIAGVHAWSTSGGDALATEQRSRASDLSGEVAGEEAVHAMVSRQSAEGYTENDMDQDFLLRLEQWSLERMRVHTERVQSSRGLPFNPSDMSAESVFVEAGDRRLAVTRIKVSGIAITAEIFGITGDEAIRVLCVTDKPVDVIITRGTCKEKVREVFGVSLDPRDNG